MDPPVVQGKGGRILERFLAGVNWVISVGQGDECSVIQAGVRFCALDSISFSAAPCNLAPSRLSGIGRDAAPFVDALRS